MRLTSKPLAALIVALMFGGIFFSSAMGWWQTESNKQVRKYTQGKYAGQGDPADIRGSYTFGDVEANFGIPAEVLALAFGVQTDDPESFRVNRLEALYAASPFEVGTASVKLFVAFYLDLPIDLAEDMYLPESAATILRTRPLSAEQLAYLEAHTVPNLEGAPLLVDPALSPELGGEHESATDTLIKGKTTFADLLAWGVEADVIEQILGMPMPEAQGMTVKDFCLQQGLEFGYIKADLQAEVDRVR